jgi:hypothetical protein
LPADECLIRPAIRGQSFARQAALQCFTVHETDPEVVSAQWAARREERDMVVSVNEEQQRGSSFTAFPVTDSRAISPQ